MKSDEEELTKKYKDILNKLAERDNNRYEMKHSLGLSLLSHLKDTVWTVVSREHVTCPIDNFPPELIGALLAINGALDDNRFYIYIGNGLVHFTGNDGLGGLLWLLIRKGAKLIL